MTGVGLVLIWFITRLQRVFTRWRSFVNGCDVDSLFFNLWKSRKLKTGNSKQQQTLISDIGNVCNGNGECAEGAVDGRLEKFWKKWWIKTYARKEITITDRKTLGHVQNCTIFGGQKLKNGADRNKFEKNIGELNDDDGCCCAEVVHNTGVNCECGGEYCLTGVECVSDE